VTDIIAAEYGVRRKYDWREHDGRGNGGAEVQYIDAEIFK